MIGGGAAVRNDGGGSNGVLKKGPWTASEDAILIDYVKKHGEGNWNAVQRNTALQRCGKSCRLRWANHLRPNLKKGAFSQDEERLISEMHSKFGNKWARIAAHLPGRTDNEVKNYWNTRVKRRYRQGLPLYPQDLPSSSQPTLHHPPPPPPPLPSFSYLKTSLPNPSLSLFDFPISVSYPTSLSSLYHPPPPPLQHRHAEPQPPISIQNQFLCQSDCSPTMDSFELNPDGDLGFDGSVTTNIQMIEQLEGFSNNPCCGSDFEIYNSELPLNQITSGQNLSDAAEVADLSKIIRVSPGLERNNSGLLDALLEEARQKGMSDNLKRKSYLDSDPQWHKISSSEISYGEFKKEKPEPESGQDHVTSMKEDLSNFLELIPGLVRAPEWCNDNGETSMGQSSISSDDNNGLEMAPVPSFPLVGASSMEEDVWNPGSYTWNNLPRIC